MDVGRIDYWANKGDSVLHKASALSKVLAAALIIAGVLATSNLFVLLTIYLAVAAAIVSTRLPAHKIALIAAYPAIFALIFAVSRWDGDVIDVAVILLRALGAALTMLMLITTTPYPQVFAVFHRLLPPIVGEGLFLTYRALFILLDLVGDVWTALRLRGGIGRRWGRSIANVSMAFGILLIRAFTLSQRLYDVMILRGYAGRLAARPRRRRVSMHDAYPLGLGLSLAALSAASRIWADVLAEYLFYAPLAALLILVATAVYTQVKMPGAVRGG